MKKTGFMKVLGRKDYIVRAKVIELANGQKTVYFYLDFTAR